MLGLSSVEPGSDGQWTVTQISCHSGIFLSYFQHFSVFFCPSLTLFPLAPLSTLWCLKKQLITHEIQMLWSEMNLSCDPDQVFLFPSSLSDLVTDMDFSPFDECLLATCSGDETVSFSFPSFYSILIVLVGVCLHTNQLSILSSCVIPGTAMNMIGFVI